MPKMTRICRFENRYLRCNSPAIYPQNRFSSVPTFCYPGVAFCSKTAILGPGSGAERGVIYDPDSRFWAQICGGKSKKSPMETIELWNSNGGKDQDRTGDTCPAYAKKVRKKFGEYRFELGIRPKYAENDANLPIWKPLFKVQLPGDLPSKSLFKCSNFLLSWRRIL